jgi:hypothetical protein
MASAAQKSDNLKEDSSSLDKGSSDLQVENVDAGDTLTEQDEKRAFARKDVSWTEEEERALVWRLGTSPFFVLLCLSYVADLRIIPLVTFLYLCNFIE